MPSGIIVRGIGGFYYVAVEKVIYECRARGIFRKDDIVPLPGDRVIISIVDENKRTGWIEEILPRVTCLRRPAVANVNQLVAVIAVKSPEPDFILLDKLLITAEKEGINLIICINKIDLDNEGIKEKIIGMYCRTGYSIISASSKIDTGYDMLKGALKDRISVLAGPSGVGKSTIFNRIMNAQIMKTSDVSRKTERGRHTTRHAELIMLDSGGYLVDTPGFSSFELTDINCDELKAYYPEFKEYEGECRFSGCSHISEPGCRVKAALDSGLIDKGRYARYQQLYFVLRNAKKLKKR